MAIDDEPFFGERRNTNPPVSGSDEPLSRRIGKLVSGEPFGVLCTQGEGQPYGSVVGFAFSEDLRAAVFATPVATRKYRLLSEDNHVALVVDNRPRHPDNMMEVESITALGRATKLERGAEFDRWAQLLLARHPQFRSFVYASSTALFRIDITRFFHVTRFQEVSQWIPPRR